jgi:hypothetical protein
MFPGEFDGLMTTKISSPRLNRLFTQLSHCDERL